MNLAFTLLLVGLTLLVLAFIIALMIINIIFYSYKTVTT